MFGRIKSNWTNGEFQDHSMEPPHDRGVITTEIINLRYSAPISTERML